MKGVAAERRLREARITVPGGERNVHWSYHFGVLQHRPLPEHSHIKQWELVHSDGDLWLCLTIERQRPLVVDAGDGSFAGLDIGWRRTKEGIRIGVLYEPTTKAYREIIVDLQKSPGNPRERVPNFRVDLGTTTWEKKKL